MPYSRFVSVVLVVLFGVLAGAPLFSSGYFNMHDDLQIMRQFEMEKCLADGQIPCRWVPDMGYGFGFPLFNFYPPLPYLIGQVIRLLGFSFVDTIKALFILSFVASGLAMYFLAKEFFGRLGGLLSAIFYIWAPYHAVDVYVRGAMNEAWALVFFPLILWTSYKLVTSDRKQVTSWTSGLALSWVGLLTSHNLMVLIFAPVFSGWCLLFLWKERKWDRIPHLIISAAVAFGLAAFFTLPAVLEQQLVQVNTLIVGYYEYIAHFVSLNQLLISRFWGWGPSVWGDVDGMPFQVGHLHWILSLVVFIFLIYRYKRAKKVNNFLLVTFYLLLVGWFSAFMAHSRSTPLWQALDPLKFVQFPWRFLAINILAFSFTSGAVLIFVKGRLRPFLASVLIFSVVFLGKDYFRPEKLGALTDGEKFTGVAWELQQTAGIYDYLPIDAKQAPKGPSLVDAEILSGRADIYNIAKGTNWINFDVNVFSEDANVRVNIFKFPNWRFFSDEGEIKTEIGDDNLGRMHFSLLRGSHRVEGKLYNTPIRTIGNLISLVSWISLGFGICLYFFKQKDFFLLKFKRDPRDRTSKSNRGD